MTEGETASLTHDLRVREVPVSAPEPDDGSEAVFGGLVLASRFQPIVSLTHRYPVGHEALLQAYWPGGQVVATDRVFAQTRTRRKLEQLDRLCLATHLRNYRRQDPGDTWLFVNVSPDVIVDGRWHGVYFGAYLKRLLASCAMPPQRLVVEIPEVAIRDEGYLTDAVHYYRSLGCLIAIDDFGAAHSNFERIWRIRPDIVKIDRAMVAEAAVDPRTRRLAANMVRLLHEAGSLVVMEGVETVEEVTVAMDADADFAQGNYLGAPERQAMYAASCPMLEPICLKFRERTRVQSERQRQRLSLLSAQFLGAVERLRDGTGLGDVCRVLSAHDGIRRCYILDADGRQLGASVEFDGQPDPRYVPLAKTIGASWFRRAYFRKAVANPRSLHWTGPYLSVTGAHMCLTLSYALEVNGALQVLCCDVDWSDEQSPVVCTRLTEALDTMPVYDVAAADPLFG